MSAETGSSPKRLGGRGRDRVTRSSAPRRWRRRSRSGCDRSCRSRQNHPPAPSRAGACPPIPLTRMVPGWRPSHQRSPTAGSTAYRGRGCMSGLGAKVSQSFLQRERRLLTCAVERRRSVHRIVGRSNFLPKHNSYAPVLLFLDGHKVLTILLVALIPAADLDLEEVHSFGSECGSPAREPAPEIWTGR